MTDNELLMRTKDLAREERQVLVSLLKSFLEIERRRLFSSLKYKSLFQMLVKEYGYSEYEATTRITAMRFLNRFPDVEQKMSLGELNLTKLNLANALFRKASLTKEEQSKFLDEISNKTTREAEQIRYSYGYDEMVKPDKIKLVSKDRVEIRCSASLELEDKIEKLKGLLAHAFPNPSLEDLFNYTCDLAIANFTKTGAPQKPRVKNSQAQIIRDVRERANNCCENCGSTYALQIDHITPRAKGGKSSFENLRLLCRSCNQRSAIEHFGQKKMNEHINRPN